MSLRSIILGWVKVGPWLKNAGIKYSIIIAIVQPKPQFITMFFEILLQ